MRRLINFRTLGFALVLIVAAGIFAACGASSDGDIARSKSVSLRNQVFTRAEAKWPIPYSQLSNFPARGALREYTIRQDRPNHPYYVYILGENGNIVQYLVAKTLPVNVCAFLSSTEDVRTSQYGNLKMTAPSLDGIFYGGAGASSACEGLIVFDQTTNAMLVVWGPGVIVSDAPLKLDLKPLQIEVVK